jgi:membrane-associated phospholipid phosphatase
MKLLLNIFILIFCFISSNASAQDSSLHTKSLSSILIDDLTIFGDDALSYFTSPARFSGQDWLLTAGLTGAALLLIQYADEPVRENLGRNTINTLNNDFWDFPTSYGIVTYANIFSLGLYTLGLFSQDDEIRIIGRMLFESISISGIAVMAARYAAGRIRPYYEQGVWAFEGFQTSNEYQSFPSGHTTVAFALSTVLAERLNSIWARIGFYGLASLTAYARVLNNQHWFSDVVIGALLGLSSGLHVVYNEPKGIEKESIKVSLYPSSKGVGIFILF